MRHCDLSKQLKKKSDLRSNRPYIASAEIVQKENIALSVHISLDHYK
jgi:hypothetical protein